MVSLLTGLGKRLSRLFRSLGGDRPCSAGVAAVPTARAETGLSRTGCGADQTWYGGSQKRPAGRSAPNKSAPNKMIPSASIGRGRISCCRVSVRDGLGGLGGSVAGPPASSMLAGQGGLAGFELRQGVGDWVEDRGAVKP